MVAEEMGFHLTTEKLICISDVDIAKHNREYVQQLFLNTDFKKGQYDKYFIENSMSKWQLECLTSEFIEKNMSDWMIIRFNDDDFGFFEKKKITVSEKIKSAEKGIKSAAIEGVKKIKLIQLALEKRFLGIILGKEEYSEYLNKNKIYEWQVKCFDSECVKDKVRVPDSVIEKIDSGIYSTNIKKDVPFFWKKRMFEIEFKKKI